MLLRNPLETSWAGLPRRLWHTWFGRASCSGQFRRSRRLSAPSPEPLESRILLAAQIVEPDSAVQTVAAEESFSFDVNYSTSDPANAHYTGLALRMHYDSTQLTFDGLANELPSGLDAQQDSADAQNLDNDPATDRFVIVLWFDINGTWPAGVTQPTRLYTAQFTTAANFTGTQIHFTAESPANVDFQSTSVTVGEAVGSLDVDGNGIADLFTDGILIARHLVGFTGQSLVNNAIGSGAIRTEPAAIAAFLMSSGDMLDPDDNGVQDLFTDGTLIARHLVGFTGQSLVNDAVGSGAGRTGSQQITDFLNQFRSPTNGAVAGQSDVRSAGPLPSSIPARLFESAFEDFDGWDIL